MRASDQNIFKFILISLSLSRKCRRLPPLIGRRLFPLRVGDVGVSASLDDGAGIAIISTTSISCGIGGCGTGGGGIQVFFSPFANSVIVDGDDCSSRLSFEPPGCGSTLFVIVVATAASVTAFLT